MNFTFYPNNFMTYEYLYDDYHHFDDYNKINKHTSVDTYHSTIYVFSILILTFSEWLIQPSRSCTWKLQKQIKELN